MQLPANCNLTQVKDLIRVSDAQVIDLMEGKLAD
jgi:hypothetical protein